MSLDSELTQRTLGNFGMNGCSPVSDQAWYVIVRRLALISSLIFVIYFGVRVAYNLPSHLRCDWGVYYKAGEATRRHEPLYSLEWGPDMTFKYAPCVGLLMAPFSLLPPVPARVLWFFADVGLFLILLALCARIQWPADRRPQLHSWPMLLAVLLSVKFLIDQWIAGQSTILFLTLTVASFYCVQRELMLPAGALLAAAVCVKLVPVCFVPYFLLHRRGMIGILSFASSLAALLMLPAAWHGWEANAALLSEWPRHLMATDIPVQAFRVNNQSVYAMMSRLLTVSDYGCNIAVWNLHDVRNLWLIVSVLAAGGLHLFLWNTRHDSSPHRAPTQLSLLLLFMTLFNPLAWGYNYVALLPTYLLLIETVRRPVRGQFWVLALFSIGFAMSSAEMGVTWLPILDTLQVWNLRCLGGFALVALVIWSYRAAAAIEVAAADRTNGFGGVSKYLQLGPIRSGSRGKSKISIIRAESDERDIQRAHSARHSSAEIIETSCRLDEGV